MREKTAFVEYRRMAQQVAEADRVSRREIKHMEPKVAFYGLVAKFIGEHMLEHLTEPAPAATFPMLDYRLNQRAHTALERAYVYMPNRQRKSLELAGRRYLDLSLNQEHGQSIFARIGEGVNTFLAEEMLATCTIAKWQSEHGPVSLAAVNASKRVPYKVALTHLGALTRNRPPGDTAYAIEYWLDEHGYNNKIYHHSMVRFDPARGLQYTASSEDLMLKESDDFAHTPQIGCPITLVRGGIEMLHTYVTTAAIESGLLHVTD